jgi:hypothetical protein
MNNFTVPMALVDYIPVIFFFFATAILMRDLYNKMTKASFALFAAGSLNITIAGALKATWKLLYAAEICNFEALNDMFFPTQSLGFLLAGAGIVMMLVKNPSRKTAVLGIAPPVFSGTFVFVGLMIAGLGIMDAVLCILSVKLKKPWLITVFTLSFICSLCMGYLSSQDFAQASMNWIAEGVNVIGQGSLLLGAILLHKNGLAQLKLHGGEQA